MENKYYIEKTIKRLEKQDGQILTEQSDILNEVKSFYEHLFSKSANTSDLELANVLENSTYPKLNTVESDGLECELLLPEISKALQNMKNGKAAGIDGFPVEFFKVFWNKLKDFVLRAYNWSYKMGNMTITLRQCVISCIPKGNKSRMLLKNWRPISLLSVVYKILSSTIANRIKTVLDSLVSKTQTGFVAGRFIGENTRLIYDILHYTEKESIPGLLMLIDFEKAFDSVSWDFLYGTLKLLGFGPKMIKWITIFNTNITGYVQQCGILSQPFPINRGCRQGDPISSYLFILGAQILQVLISENHVIKGIKINGKEIKLTQFADDTTLILDGTTSSLQATLNTLEIFGTLSGLRMNTEKTQMVWIGKRKHCKEKLNVTKGLVWGNDTFSLLGIKFSVDLDLVVNLNYEPVLDDLNKSLNVWKKGSLHLWEKSL